MKAFVLLVVGLQSLLVFGERREVDWDAGIPLAPGSAAGPHVAARLATGDRTRVWVFRLLVIVLSVVRLPVVDSGEYLQHAQGTLRGSGLV